MATTPNPVATILHTAQTPTWSISFTYTRLQWLIILSKEAQRPQHLHSHSIQAYFDNFLPHACFWLVSSRTTFFGKTTLFLCTFAATSMLWNHTMQPWTMDIVILHLLPPDHLPIFQTTLEYTPRMICYCPNTISFHGFTHPNGLLITPNFSSFCVPLTSLSSHNSTSTELLGMVPLYQREFVTASMRTLCHNYYLQCIHNLWDMSTVMFWIKAQWWFSINE